MSTFTVSTTYSHSVTHVAAKMLLTIKEIIREIGLDPAKFVADWPSYELAISTWLSSRHLQRVILEVFNPITGELVKRFDMDVAYATVGEGTLWVDTAAVRYSIAKAGLVPSTCQYELLVENSPGRPEVPGWGACALRSTEGFRRFGVGATIGGTGLTAQTSYWSR
jgi:hypothetical protein